MNKNILSTVKLALKEDIASGDITSKLTISAKKKIKAQVIAKEKGIVCGLDVARSVFKTVDKKIQFQAKVSDGNSVRKGKVLARLEGNARSILAAERVTLNFLSHLSGIATLTFQYVQKVKPYRVKILDTRKTTPGLRILEKYAVRCGGGANHRMGLWDQVLVKDNHLSVVSCKSSVVSIRDLIKNIKQKIPKNIKVEVEVKNLRDFKQALLAHPDIIMLDNFSVQNIKKASKLKNHSPFTIHHSPQLEVSGGVNLKNVRRIAATGVDRISIGELTHSAKALDIALNCE